MRLLLLFVLMSLTSCAATAQHDLVRFGSREAPPRTSGMVRLCTYNVENLFDAVDDPVLSGDQEDIDDRKPDVELEALAKTIRAVDADILAIQEVESLDALLWFRDGWLDGLGYDHVVSIDSGDGRGIENAVLSRFPLDGAKVWPGLPLGGVHPEKYGSQPNWYAGEPIAFRRSPLQVDVRIDDYVLTLIVVHHKSGRYNDYWREAESRKIVGFVEEMEREDPSRNIAVLGDFNATEAAKSVLTYHEAGLEDGVRGVRSGPEKVWITHASGRRIDRILVNRSFASEIGGVSFVLGTPILPEGVDYREADPPEGYASDHFPLVIEFTPRD